MTPVGAVGNPTASAQLETAPTKHRERKYLFIFSIHYNETLQIDEVSKLRLPGDGKIRAMTPVGAVGNPTASAQLETAPTKHRERKYLFIFSIHYNETLQIDEVSKLRLPGDGKIRAMTPVGAVGNPTASAQLETAPTKHRERKYLFIFSIHYKSILNSMSN